MSVSLKKPSESVKLDLSKPVMDKLPECTPVHLIDEEETIKPRVSQPKQIDPLSVEHIRLHHSEEEERKIWDLYDKAMQHEHLKRILLAVAIVVSGIALAVLVVVLVMNFKLPDIEFELLDFISPVLDYLGGNSLFMLLMLLSCIGFGIKVMRCLINVTRK